jgi:hypothetical protein
MGRLIKEALYSNELVEEHMLRARKFRYPYDADPDGEWRNLPRRIREIDPDGERSYALLQELEAKA